MTSVEDTMRISLVAVWVALWCPISVVHPHRIYKKCCKEGERLDSKAEKCENIPGIEVGGIVFELLDLSKHSNRIMWLPRPLPVNIVKLMYDEGPKHRWNAILNADDQTSWCWRTEDRIWVESDEPNIRGVTNVYCFDATTGAHARVLLALVTNITKCCRKDEELSFKESGCVSRQRGSNEKEPDFEIINLQTNDSTSALEWLPPQLRRGGTITVSYRHGSYISPNHSIIRIHPTDPFVITYTDNQERQLSLGSIGQSLVTRSPNFCFDTVQENPTLQVIAAELPHYITFRKCCVFGKRLTPDGTCETNSANDWVSLVHRHTTKDGYTIHPRFHLPKSSMNYSFEVLHELSEEISHRDASAILNRKVYSGISYYCIDVQRTRDGRLRDVLAHWPPLALLYRKVRPLHMLAAGMLAMAVCAILSRREMRRNTHGLALASHASCLVVTNSLQSIWFLVPYDKDHCLYYVYPIYFFLLAGAFWLNAVAVNMAYGFRQPLGALARSGDGGWRRLVVLSVYSWGTPAALTAFAVFMKTNEEKMIRKGFITPMFFETRTCSMRHVLFVGSIGEAAVDIHVNYQLGSLLYYYTPLALLVLANSVCLILTVRKIRELRKGSSYIKNTSRPHRRTVVYVKLLLSAGVVELLVEAISLAVILKVNFSSEIGLQPFYGKFYIFAIVATLLDLSRAVAVLWLCISNWRWAGAGWNLLWGRLNRGRTGRRETLDSSLGDYPLGICNPAESTEDEH